jgi:hypothetical protein
MVKAKDTEKDKILKKQRFLYILVTSLVFEGLVRKILPSFLGLPIFFFKDILCIIIMFNVAKDKLQGYTAKINKYWKIVFFAFVPLLIVTALLDPILAIFGLKQYLLYVVVAILVPTAFPPNQEKEFIRFIAFFAMMLLPTTFIAAVQNSLPSTHWLNLSVDGSNLEGFSAAGFLRVSSTFSFNAQYAYFLNTICCFLGARLFLDPQYKSKFWEATKKYTIPILGISLLIGTFITGSRSAVYGCALCIFIGAIFIGIKSPKLVLGKGVLLLVVFLVSFTLIQTIKPEFFAAYNKRTENSSDYSSSEEFTNRVKGSVFNWTSWIFDLDFKSSVFGRGLAVMSNGSDKVSSYADSIRSQHIWTETDMATTIWEGGFYLLIVWYGLRIAIVFMCFRIWRSLREKKYVFAVSFILAIVIINGFYGTLSIQPPLALWWWMSVGCIIAIKGFDRKRAAIQINNQLAVNLNQ